MIKTVGVDQDITIADDIRFILETRDGSDCLKNPYQITNATIYFITREFTDSIATEYQKEYEDKNLVREYESVKKELCIKLKQNVKAATTENVSLFGEQTIDGIDLIEGDRVLVKNQNNLFDNGIYIVNQDVWIRSTDANTTENILKGMYLFVENGIENINTGWFLETPKQIKIGSTPLVFIKFSTEDEYKESPDENSKSRLESLKNQIEESKKKFNFYYKDAIAIKSFGGYVDPETGEVFPAWLNPSMVPSDISEKVLSDNILSPHEENGELVDGKFALDWSPLDCREGDYFICWSWMPNLEGEILSSHIFFSLEGNGQLTTSIPTHLTSPKKYEILMERYLPEMFKTIVSNSDLTPKVLQEFNKSVAKGFTYIENQANQIIDLLDANATHEQLLPLLANLFNLKLKSNDPTLWRRQIKKAIPNFKRKGSIIGLKEAFSDAGIRFLSIKRMWQVISKYTYQEHFNYEGSNTFKLSKNILTLDSSFRLWHRAPKSDWEELTEETENWFDSYVEIANEESLLWKGFSLSEGHSIKVLYKFRNMPEGEKLLDEYIRLLPLMDQRDERTDSYPIKNWNTHLIEEDDDLFDRVVPVRHPLADPIVWGRIRTEFPYSENAYNMEEYNGSKRDSYDPCDIDKEFLDPCSQCQSSSFILDLEVEKLSDESYFEAKKISEEYMPFHAVIHSFNLVGAINEFIRPSSEKIDALVTFSKEDVLLAGEGQHIFNRSVDRSEIKNMKRNLLSDFSVVSDGSKTTWGGTFKNKNVILCASGLNTTGDLNNESFSNKTQGFSEKNINTTFSDVNPFESSNLLEVLGVVTKNYSLSSFGFSFKVFNEVEDGMIGPLFEYRISNKIADYSASIQQVNRIIFGNEDADFGILGIVTQHDVDLGLSDSEPWTLRTSDRSYKIENILPDGTLLLGDYFESDSIEGWQILDGDSVVKESTLPGTMSITNYGLVQLNETSGIEKIKIGDYVYVGWSGSNGRQYKIKSFKKDELNKFYIEGYDQGGVGGEEIKIYRRIVENKVGKFAYEGLLFEANDNLESLLSISNSNSSNLKENYLLIRDQKYYSISDINGSSVTLNGPWDDLTLAGQVAEFSIYKFEKQSLNLKERQIPYVPGYEFDSIDRAGKGVITMTQENILGLSLAILNSSGNDEKIDIMSQNESIDFSIEYKEQE